MKTELEKTSIVTDFIYNDHIQEELSKINTYMMDFNILEITGMGNQEIKHSNILGWLFGKNEHNLEYTILENFLKNLTELNNFKDLNTYLYLSSKPKDIIIFREKDDIDLLIVDEANKKVFAIENKIYAKERVSGEDGGQLQKYEDIINNKYDTTYDKHFIYLTIDLEKPSKENWLIANHQMIVNIIEKIVISKDITEKTKIILESYVDMLKRNGIVEDNQLKELCRKIWAKKEYRDALNILFENEPTNHQKISDILIHKLENIGATTNFYAGKNNDIMIKTKSISNEEYNENEIYFNLDFDYFGIRLAIYINDKNTDYDNLYEKLFPQNIKRYNRNQIIKITENWNDILSDIDIYNLETKIEEDILKILNELNRFDKLINKMSNKA